jgi:glycosyltransferase involved in cell wall biosynthesis
MPRVSVIIPVYNCERFLKECINSVLSQSFSDFELIVIDDGSTDSTFSILESYHDPRIKLFRKFVNQGYVHALNDGLKMAEGEFIARLDADDYSCSSRFELQVDYLVGHPNCGLVASFVDDFFGNKIVSDYMNSVRLKFEFLIKNPFVHSSVMFRKELLNRYYLSYDVDLLYAEDYKFWFDFSKVSEVALLPVVLTKYRKHLSQISQKYNSTQKNTFFKVNLSVWQYYIGRDLTLFEIEALKNPAQHRKEIMGMLNEIFDGSLQNEFASDFLISYCKNVLKFNSWKRRYYFDLLGLTYSQKLIALFGR